MTVVDRTGQRYGRLLVIKRVENDKHGKSRWECLCDCGNTHTVTAGDFKKTKSCGCLLIEVSAARFTTHGLGKGASYSRWCNMHTRCTNPNSRSYPNYGGRGISICREWEDYSVFYQDMGDPPFETAQIDRIDNDKGYSKENCRWTTPSENCRNKGNNYRIPHNGREVTLSEAAEVLGKNRDNLKYSRVGETKEQRTDRVAALLVKHAEGIYYEQ